MTGFRRVLFRSRTPFLETPLIKYAKAGDEKDEINQENIKSVKKTFADGIEEIVIGYREDLIQKPEEEQKSEEKQEPGNKDGITIQDMREAFDTIDGWLKKHFRIKG